MFFIWHISLVLAININIDEWLDSPLIDYNFKIIITVKLK